jgi:hypothetical protein
MKILTHQDPVLHKLFETFLEVWENAHFSELAYTCKKLAQVSLIQDSE